MINNICSFKCMKVLIPLVISFFLLVFVVDAFAGEAKELADGLYYNSQYEKAIEKYLEVLEHHIDKPEINYQIGLCYFLLHNIEDSMKYWIKAKELDPGIFNGRIFRVPAGSMKPTIINGDHIIIDQDYYEHKNIKRADVVVFLSPKDTNKVSVKRVIGLPGDRIEIRNKEVYINKKKYYDSVSVFADKRTIESKVSVRDNFGPVTIPEGNYFMLGDNRDESFDSRFFGFVDRERILGKALVIYLSSPNAYSMENIRPGRIARIIR